MDENMQKYRVVGVAIDVEGVESHWPLFHTFGMKDAAYYIMANAEDFELRFARIYIEEE